MGALYVGVFVFITMIASFSLSQVYAEPTVHDDDYIIEKFVTGLEYPTTMEFIGDDILVLEKNTGKVIRILENGVILNEPVLDVPVSVTWEAGLLGITSVSDKVYLFFTESLSDQSTTLKVGAIAGSFQSDEKVFTGSSLENSTANGVVVDFLNNNFSHIRKILYGFY